MTLIQSHNFLTNDKCPYTCAKEKEKIKAIFVTFLFD